MFLAGGSDDDVAAAAAILDAIGRRTFHLGAVGDRAVAKLIVNGVMALGRTALAEGLALRAGAKCDDPRPRTSVHHWRKHQDRSDHRCRYRLRQGDRVQAGRERPRRRRRCRDLPQIEILKNRAKERGVTLGSENLDVTDGGDRRKALGWDVEILVNNAGVLEGADGFHLVDGRHLVVAQNLGTDTAVELVSTDGWKSAAVVRRHKSALSMPSAATQVGRDVYVLDSRIDNLFDPQAAKVSEFAIEKF